MTQAEQQREQAGAGPDDDALAARILGALPRAPIDPAFSKQALRAARTELDVSRSRWRRAEVFFARVMVPVALLLCAVGWAYHFLGVAQHIYASHG